jgi:hypothetical protein
MKDDSKKSVEEMHMVDDFDFVPIAGIIYQLTALGAFLEVGTRRVFLPDNCLLSTTRGFQPGEVVTLQVLRTFAKRKNLIP